MRGARQPRERLGQRDRIGRCQAGTRVEARGDQAEGAETGCGLPAGTPQLAEELHGAGLAVGPGDRDHDARLAARQPGGELGQPAPRLRILEQRTRRDARRPRGTGRSQDGDCAARYRVGDECAAVNAAAGKGREQIPGRHAAAVGGDAGDFEPSRIPPGGGNAAGVSQGGGLAHDVSEPQRAAAATAGRCCGGDHARRRHVRLVAGIVADRADRRERRNRHRHRRAG